MVKHSLEQISRANGIDIANVIMTDRGRFIVPSGSRDSQTDNGNDNLSASSPYCFWRDAHAFAYLAFFRGEASSVPVLPYCSYNLSSPWLAFWQNVRKFV